MKISKLGIWITAVYLLIHLFFFSASGTDPYALIINYYLVIHNIYLLELFGVRIADSWLLPAVLFTAFQVYILCYFISYLFRKKF